MKAFFKWVGIAILTIIILLSAFAAHEWNAEKPFYFNNYLNRTVLQLGLESPETLTSLGFLESVGITSHNGELNDDSPEKGDELYDVIKQAKITIEAYTDAELSEAEQLSKEIALYLINAGIESEPYRYHNYPVNQLFGLQSNFPSFMDAQHRVPDMEAAQFYVDRLNKVKTKFEQNLLGLKIREDKNIIPPRFVINRVLEEMNAFVGKAPEENILYTSLQAKLDKLDEVDDADKQDILAQAKQAMLNNVYPAYQLLIDYFVQIKNKAGNDDGFWHLPGGDIAYQQSLRFFTTTNYSAEQIHQTGLQEVDRIQKNILTILAAQDFDVSQGFTQAIETLSNDESFYYPDTDEGREQILADYKKILDEINTGMEQAFNIRPEAGVDVKRIPEFKEKTAPGAYYQQPAIDGSRPGVFYANLYDIKATPKYSMRTLAYHEGIPGHHFQIATAMELEGLPFFRKFSPFTAYVEGWALYSEYLAWEMGFQDDPFDNIGRLQAELFRAVRLVVDTGIHAKRWTREEAITYMLANTGMAETDVISEIERYIVMPGQATAYKTGMMKILEVRQKAKDALGDKFDLSEFHDVVLKNGAVPLDIMEKLVDRYIADKKAN
jgi:uncharacterized protein (DUF885 family)